jgi:outer membrane protein assembly factor BamA
MQNRACTEVTVTFPTRIDTVLIVGNEHTKNHVILREIPFSFPDTLDEGNILEIHNRIQNLYLFNRVELQVSKFEDLVVLMISVTESWYFFPVPLLFINERDWSKLSYGLQFNHYNFRGQNEKLFVGGWLGYDPSFFFTYLNPWFGKSKRIIWGFSAFHNKTTNKIFDFNESRTGIRLKIGKQLTLKLKTDLEIVLQRISFPEAFQKYSVSKKGADFVPMIQYHILYDARDLYEYPKKGIFLDYVLQRSGFTEFQPQYWQFMFDNRIYKPINQDITIAARNLVILTKGPLPIYNRPYFGYKERIRGYFSRVFPDPVKFIRFNSPELSLTSLEIRFPLVPIKYFTYDNLPFLSMFSKNLKFGISGGFFIDSGIAWQRKSEFNLRNFFTGYGGGLHIHLPYINLLRFEHAWNDQGQSQFIIDAGVAF